MTPHRMTDIKNEGDICGLIDTSLGTLQPEARKHAGLSEALQHQASFRQQTSLRGTMSLLPLGARQQQVLCLGTTCTMSAMSSATATGRYTSFESPAALRGEETPLNGSL